jgi:hypothetical protein
MSTDFKTLTSPSGPSSTPGPFRAAIGRPINSVAFAPYRHVQLGRIIRIDGEAVASISPRPLFTCFHVTPPSLLLKTPALMAADVNCLRIFRIRRDSHHVQLGVFFRKRNFLPITSPSSLRKRPVCAPTKRDRPSASIVSEWTCSKAGVFVC